MMMRAAMASLLVSHVVVYGVSAQDSEFFALGHLEDTEQGRGKDISNTGRVVGEIGCTAGGYVAFQWAPDSGMQLLESPEGCAGSTAYGISDDGQVVAGFGNNPQGNEQAFVWTEQDGLTLLPPLGEAGESYRAQGISGDGQVIVGAEQVNGNWNGIFWNGSGTPTTIGLLAQDDPYSALASASEDGGVVVGRSRNANGNFEAVRWTNVNGLQALGFLPGGTFSWAQSASANGETIVGYSRVNGTLDTHGFVWTATTGMTSIGFLPGGDSQSRAHGVSATGDVVVGWSLDATGNAAIIWTRQTGMRRLDDFLKNSGATGLDGWQLTEAEAISANGEWVTGQGLNPSGLPEAFAARIDTASLLEFVINPGLNDAWYNPATPGQGFFITVFADIGQVFAAWFTYDTERPPQNVEAQLGEPSHRWLVALGPYEGDTVELDVINATGGIFDDPTPVTESPPESYGTMTLKFQDCRTGTLDYDLFSLGLTGSIPIQRIAEDNVPLCTMLAGEANN